MYFHYHRKFIPTCVNGYQPSVAMEKFSKLHGFLAHAEKDKKDFKVINVKKIKQRLHSRHFICCGIMLKLKLKV